MKKGVEKTNYKEDFSPGSRVYIIYGYQDGHNPLEPTKTNGRRTALPYIGSIC
jgi:hypothetical protein